MQNLTITLALLLPLAVLAGVIVGAWIVHRSHLHLSPMPDVPAALKSLVSVIRRSKPNTTTRVSKPRMRA